MSWTLPDELMFLRNRKIEQKQTNELMTNKIVVISGATSGVGLSALRRFAQGGAHLVMVVRNLQKAQQVQAEIQQEFDVTIDIVIADFSDLDSVRQASKQLLQTYPRIDVLINSAGIHSTRKTYTKDGFETVFCVNHLAPFLLTKLLLERMKQSAPSRIIQVNSEGHRFNGLRVHDLNWRKRIYTGLRSYGASKTAQLLTVWKMDEDLRGTGVTINAMHPGDVRTNIGSNNGRLYRWFLRHVTWRFLKDPIISGESIYYLAAAPELATTSGKFFNLTIEEIPAKHALNPKTGQLIWEKSIELTGLDK